MYAVTERFFHIFHNDACQSQRVGATPDWKKAQRQFLQLLLHYPIHNTLYVALFLVELLVKVTVDQLEEEVEVGSAGVTSSITTVSFTFSPLS